MTLTIIGYVVVVLGTLAALLWEVVPKGRPVFRGLVVLLGCILPVGGTFLTAFPNQKETIELNRQISAATGEVAILTSHVSDLLSLLAQKPELDPQTRTQIIQTREKYEVGEMTTPDLSSLVSAWSNKVIQGQVERERKLAAYAVEQKDNLKPFLDICDYALRRFPEILHQKLSPYGVKVFSDFRGLPAGDEFYSGNMKSTGSRAGEDFEICEISVQTNYEWTCRCVLYVPDIQRTTVANMRMYCSGKNGTASLCLVIENGKLKSSLEAQNVPSVQDYYPLDDYKSGISEVLGLLVAAQAGNFTSSTPSVTIP